MRKETKTKKKVKLYFLKSISDKIMKDVSLPKGHKKSLYEIDQEIVIIKGTKGIIVSASLEGVHTIIKNEKENIRLDIRKKPIKDKKGRTSFCAFPLGTITVSLKYILDLKPKSHDLELGQSVRIFGDRLNTNYALLLRSCEEVGLNLKEYDTNRTVKSEYEWVQK